MINNRLQHAVDHSAKRLWHSKNRVGFVYLVGCGKYTKVGITNKISCRLNGLQVGNPHELKVLKLFPSNDMVMDESALHSALSQYHHRGEWFKLPDDVLKRLLAKDTLSVPMQGVLSLS